MNDGDREQIIRDAVKIITNKGVILGIQQWGLEWKKTKEQWAPKKDQTCCALACVVLAYQNGFPEHMRHMRPWILTTTLGTNDTWVDLFRKGFDGYPKDEKYDKEDFAYELGVLMREELVK